MLTITPTAHIFNQIIKDFDASKNTFPADTIVRSNSTNEDVLSPIALKEAMNILSFIRDYYSFRDKVKTKLNVKLKEKLSYIFNRPENLTHLMNIFANDVIPSLQDEKKFKSVYKDYLLLLTQLSTERDTCLREIQTLSTALYERVSSGISICTLYKTVYELSETDLSEVQANSAVMEEGPYGCPQYDPAVKAPGSHIQLTSLEELFELAEQYVRIENGN